VSIAVMPFFHIYGLTVGINTAIANAITTILIPNPRDMVRVLTAIQKHRATFYPAVPTMVAGLNNFPSVGDYDLTSLRFAACMDPVESPRPRSIGVPMPDTDLKIVDVETGEKEMSLGEIGVPHEKRGETVKAFVVLKEGAQVTEDEIIAFCRENMAAYKIPRSVEFIDVLPKSLVGKVLRRELRESLA